MLDDEHHREPVNPDAPARCAGTTGLFGQSITTQAAPGETPAYRPPIRSYVSLRLNQARCALTRICSYNHPCNPLKGMAFCCGTRLARVECLQKEGWGHPIPRFSRAKPAAAASHHRARPSFHGACSACKPYPNAAGVKKPRCPLCFHRPRGLHRLARRWGRLCHLAMQRARDSVELVSFFVRHLSRRATLCLSALHPLRQAIKAVGHYAQGLSGLADLPCGRLGIRFSRPVARRAPRQFAAQSAFDAQTKEANAAQDAPVHTEAGDGLRLLEDQLAVFHINSDLFRGNLLRC